MSTDPSSQDHELAHALTQLLAPALDDTSVHVEDLRLLSGGASRETWSFDAVSASSDPHRRSLVLQRSRGGEADSTLGIPMEVEDALIDAAGRNGVPVPTTVLDAATAAPLLGPARVAEHVEGETLAPRIVRDERFAAARAVLATQCGQALARIHTIDPSRLAGLEVVEPLDRLRAGLDLVDEARPAFELALRRLAESRPPERAPRLVHGDFRLGNLVVDETGLRAVLDWELAHLGDPVEDLGWLCVRSWRFGGPGLVAGVGELDDLLTAYADAGGDPVDPAAVSWWIAVGTLTWGLICAVQARRHLDGHVRSVELAAIGRRVCETEYDLLQLLDVPPPTPTGAGAAGPPAAPAPQDGFHGRPSAVELIEAVRAHLGEQVAPRLDGAAAFHLKVASNALAVVERELRLSPVVEASQRERLDRIGFSDERALAAAIRAGSCDAGPEVLAVVRAAVVDRLRVANPKWLQPPDRL